MELIKFDEVLKDYEYYIEFVDDKARSSIYKIIDIYEKEVTIPSPTRDLGNGLMEVLAVHITRTSKFIKAINVFTKEEVIIDTGIDLAYKIYKPVAYDRYIAGRRYQADCYRNILKDKELQYVTETVASACIVLDVRYSEIKDTINFIIMDVHLTSNGVEVKRSRDIKFPGCKEWEDMVHKLYDDFEDTDIDWRFK